MRRYFLFELTGGKGGRRSSLLLKILSVKIKQEIETQFCSQNNENKVPAGAVLFARVSSRSNWREIFDSKHLETMVLCEGLKTAPRVLGC